ncbi:MAG: hypothetical protein ACKO9B_00740 [Planctomycetota bacterium]
MNIVMDDFLERELLRLAAEQGRDLSEVVETALRNYIVAERFADDLDDALAGAVDDAVETGLPLGAEWTADELSGVGLDDD